MENEEPRIEERGVIVRFLSDLLKGAAMGVAFIIPGFSGGTVAAVLGIYEKLVDAVTDIFRHFFRSFKILLPIVLGILLGVAALVFPIQWGMARYPLPTVCLFVGLALGGVPPLGARAGKLNKRRGALFTVSLILSAALIFLPSTVRSEGFLYSLDPLGYTALCGVGFIASCALVVPGISGSMLLLIMGYYEPILTVVTDLFRGTMATKGILVLILFGIGLVVGFFFISYVMKWCLKKYPHATYYVVLGFILGSLVAVFALVIRGGVLLSNVWYWLISIALLVVGFLVSFIFFRISSKDRVQ